MKSIIFKNRHIGLITDFAEWGTYEQAWQFNKYGLLLTEDQQLAVQNYFVAHGPWDGAIDTIIDDIVGLAEGGPHFLPKIKELR